MEVENPTELLGINTVSYTHLDVYKRQGVDYVRCLDCDQVFEAEDLEAIVSAYDEDDEPAA